MNTLRTRTTIVATAIAAALSLAACGDGRDDSAATRADNAKVAANTTTTTSSAPYANDRATADASSTAARADKATERAGDKVDAATDRAAAKVENAGDRAAAAAGDAALTAKVKAALMAEPGIDSLQIDVDTSGGRVTLSGEVDNAQNRSRALQVARGVDGVNGVVDRLSMKRQ
ncbi:MAG TPA: BON domain-containing protein [Casimicrobiaceae bacterium]|nr:BON domain-containing protein [Casimicrobiaceae bacterium]